MTTGPEDERRPAEPTFADVLNAFSFDSGHSRSRRWRRHKDDDHAGGNAEPDRSDTPGTGSHARHDAAPYRDQYAAPYADQPDDQYGDRYDDRPGARHEELEPDPVLPEGGGSAQVRPYAWTRGRTRSGFALEIETLVSTSARGREQLGLLQYEHRSVADLCHQVRSVAEVAALLGVPLGVAKVLVGDMAGLGLLVVHQTSSGNGDIPDLALMERVLSGLRRL